MSVFGAFRSPVIADGDAGRGDVMPDARVLTDTLLALEGGVTDEALVTDDARERARVALTTRSLLRSMGVFGRVRVGVGDLSSVCEGPG